MKVPSVIDKVCAWKRRSRISYELNSMSDRNLADIGIARGDIPSAVAGSPYTQKIMQITHYLTAVRTA